MLTGRDTNFLVKSSPVVKNIGFFIGGGSKDEMYVFNVVMHVSLVVDMTAKLSGYFLCFCGLGGDPREISLVRIAG